MADTLLFLDNPVQNYAWGSRSAIASLLGRHAPSAQPEAELWIGAHPKAPSRVVDMDAIDDAERGDDTLDRLIAQDPLGILGPAVRDRFGAQLPFLFKVLAAAAPLSIQAHPNQEQARAGFAREDAAGVPLDSPRRNYCDANHKPELVCALTDFDALKGFRDVAAIDAGLRPIAGRELEAVVQGVGAPGGLRALLQQVLALDGSAREAVLGRAGLEAARRSSSNRAWLWVSRLLSSFPGDTGALAPLYLNLVTLRPGEALYLPAGELHAYLEGVALEIMASSDNVLRGGLTPKHVDVAELLSALQFEPHPPDVLRGIETGPGERSYPTAAREFELALIDVAPGRTHVSAATRGVEILLAVDGAVVVRAGDTTASLDRGRSVLVPASCPGYELRGTGQVARARVPA